MSTTTEPVAAEKVVKEYKGGCHCKKFQFEFTHEALDTSPVISCNCTICNQRGYLLIFVPAADFKPTEGSLDDLSKYEFGKKHLVHRFCSNCGCGVLCTGAGTVAVNARAIEGLDTDKLTLKHYDGLSL
ncbi:hypothetical protein BD410DRAFT_753139 [Rickenella mellea]|uniref:CENP-V/GFA domain-containing protein n=1 Tax=Rickenella mellea TaxID=50990 RepID=A0A4Y7PTX7_9AGAM|nr:hypothetical protein BD410DRAFT_753139 [Rickenella mellea]